MNEFRKSYEYEEEQSASGFLLVFCLMLVSTELFLGGITLIKGAEALNSNRFFSAIFLISGIVCMAFALLSGIFLYKRKRFAIILAKIFLVFRVVFHTGANIIIFLHLYNNPYSIGLGDSQYKTVKDLVVTCLIFPVFYTWAFSIFWGIYLKKSKRVQEIFPSSF